jgi:putative membrane protein
LTVEEGKGPDEAAAQREGQPALHTLSGRMRAAVANLSDSDASAALSGKSANELAEIRTDLAVARNIMAADRTLMAWIRTALSMDSFGFAIYKILEGYRESGANLPRENSPRNIGLFLTGMGTLAMVMGALEYWKTIKELRLVKVIRIARPTFVMGILMAGMGIFLFFAIVMKAF